MCGLAGYYCEVGAKQNIIEKQLKKIDYRGPDAQGIYIDKHVALGHNRLSIIDIQNAQQPMSSIDGRYVLIFNGEIYNYLELRQNLVKKGVIFKTYSDTEVLLYMLIHYGMDGVKQLNGMFAFAFYDKHENTILLVRDHFGIKPLYYTQQNNDFIFASEIKAILQYPGIQSTVDWDSVQEYMVFQLMLKKHTLYQGIYSLEPASYLVIQNGKIKEKGKFWDYHYAIDYDKSPENFSEELLSLIENSVSIQKRSDVPVGAYLSGGIDSSIVSTLASRNTYGEFQTFSGAFKEGKEYDETEHAKAVSNNIKSTHHVLYPRAQDFINSFEKICISMDYPEAGPGVFSQFMVSKLAKEHVKVVLGGQGGDEIFGGYTRYAIAYLEQALKGAIFETQEEGKHVVTLQSIIPNMSQMKQYVPLLKQQFGKGLFEPMDKRYYQMINRSPNLRELYQDEFINQLSEDQIFEKFSKIFNHPETKSYFNKMTHFDMKTLLPALLHIEDRASMAVSIESRVPLLDYRIVELAAQMPPALKFSGGKTKAMLIDTARHLLPASVVNRKDKMGFTTPINKWMAGDLKEYVLDLLLSKDAKERGIYNLSAIEKQVEKGSGFSRELWGILNLEMWFKQI